MAAHIFYGSICVHFCQFMDETGAPNYSNFVDECACCKSGGTTVCGGRVWGCICIRKSGASRIIAKSIVPSKERRDISAAFFMVSGSNGSCRRDPFCLSGAFAGRLLVWGRKYVMRAGCNALADSGGTPDAA